MMQWKSIRTAIVAVACVVATLASPSATTAVEAKAPALPPGLPKLSPEKKCGVCTVVIGLIETVALDQHLTVDKAALTVCDDILVSSPLLRAFCQIGVKVYIGKIAKDFKDGVTPDVTCRKTLKFCPKRLEHCTLYKTWPSKVWTDPTKGMKKKPKSPIASDAANAQHSYPISQVHPRHHAHYAQSLLRGLQLDTEDVGVGRFQRDSPAARSLLATAGKVKQTQHNPAGKKGMLRHLPSDDADGDFFSTKPTLRGSHWRGRDCDDTNPTVYPGRRAVSMGHGGKGEGYDDHNCNGIPDEYDAKWCANSGQRGLIVIGDSVSAHFRLPPRFLDASRFTNKTFTDVLTRAEDELDFPECSWATGHGGPGELLPSKGSAEDAAAILDAAGHPVVPPAGCPISDVPLLSIYQRMLRRNRCNHRDFQNMGVNGAAIRDVPPPHGLVTDIKYRLEHDQPATVMLPMFGNDVCNKYHNFSQMTTPQEFHKAALASLRHLDSVLPANSTVITAGVADARVLFDTMHALTHPLGETYSTVYDYLNCLEVSPCWGWMNTNKTVRDTTYRHVQALNKVYPDIIDKETFEHITVHYYPTDFSAIFKEWKASGRPMGALIEPSDGFHPSQTGQMLLGKAVWQFMSAYPDAIGPINPYNDDILANFGNQGGY